VGQVTEKSLGSFFSGIGGFEHGAEDLFNVKFQSEIDGVCCKVLEKNFPGVKNFGDIETIVSSKLPMVDIYTAGFPCQDVSLARGGRGRDGLSGSRSGLFFTLLEIIKSKKPEVVVLENVLGLRSSNSGRDFATILHLLNLEGYDIGWRSLNSRFHGVPQNRDRVYIVAKLRNSNSRNFLLKVLFPANCLEKNPPIRKGFITPSSKQGVRGEIVPQVSYCISATTGRHTGTDWSRTYVTGPDYVRRITPSEAESLQGFPKGWTKVSPEDDDSPRYHAIGNAVTVNVSRRVLTRISQAMDQVSVDYIEPTFMEAGLKTNQDILSISEWWNLQDNDDGDEDSDVAFKWCNSGLYINSELNQSNKTNSVLGSIITTEIVDILDNEISTIDDYILSKNAIEGIIRRTDSQKRTLFQPLRKILDDIANC